MSFYKYNLQRALESFREEHPELWVVEDFTEDLIANRISELKVCSHICWLEKFWILSQRGLDNGGKRKIETKCANKSKALSKSLWKWQKEIKMLKDKIVFNSDYLIETLLLHKQDKRLHLHSLHSLLARAAYKVMVRIFKHMQVPVR